MARTWVLDTSTKGTGANVVPLDQPAETKAAAPREPVYVPPKPRPRAPAPPPIRRPRRFKVVDLVSADTLAEDVDLRTTVDLLKDVRSVVDVRVHVWDHDADRWRMLTLGEQRALWDAGHR